MNILVMIKRCTVLLYLIAFLALSAAEQEDPLVIKLSTESSLSPLYLLPIVAESTDFQDFYIQQLEKVLTFDLNHNGSTIVAKRSIEYDRMGQGDSSNQLGSISTWKEHHIFYVIKPVVQERILSTLALDVQGQSLKNLGSIPLSGDLANDRKQIHLLADRIHKALFDTEGIASTRICYTLKTSHSPDSTKWISEVWEADYDGENAHQLTQDRSYCVTPVYLPPKKGFKTGGFLFVSYQLGQPKIFLSTLKDGKKRRFSYMKGNQLMPAVSQQRDKVAFICDITGNPDLFLQPFSPEKGAIGKPQQIFSARQATQGSPTFSPDGNRIAFVSNKDGSPKIYVIQIPQSGAQLKDVKATLISKSNRENSAPSWSPDGTKLAYCSRTQGERQIWVYDFNSGQEKQMTKGPGHKENPCWAPNSLHLVYNTSDPLSSELFIMNLNQLEPIKISRGGGEKCFPNWEPRIH